MHRSPEIRAYAQTVGPTREAIDAMDGTQPGDPREAAQAILTAIDAPEPPLRLALGDDAVTAISDALERRLANLRMWESLSRATTLTAAT